MVRAIGQTVEGRRGGLPLLAASCGGLVLAHPPTGLLWAIMVLPAFALFCTRSPARLLSCAAGALLGIGPAAVHLMPALSAPAFPAAAHWLVLAPQRWNDAATMQTLTAIALALAVLLAGLCIALLQMAMADDRRGAVGFWIAIGLGSLVVIVGLVSSLWDLPVMAALQFPGRLMAMVEFAAVTTLCLVPLTRLRRVVVYFFAAAAVALVPAALSVTSDLVRRAGPPGPPPVHSLVPWLMAQVAAPVPPWGWAISGLSLLVLAGLAIRARRRED
ncbi:hypothetical protein BH11PSE3_BH11PSE3_06560 [soil metagenome]